MKTALNCGERLIVCSILPKEGNFITLRMIRTLIGRLGLTAEEITSFGIEEKDGQVRWNLNGNISVPFEFAQAEYDLIKEQLKKLNDTGKLTSDTFTVYEKFCA
jgi:hypothetical protein